MTEEIARIRGVPAGRDCASPAFHTAFADEDGLIEFVERVADATGLPAEAVAEELAAVAGYAQGDVPDPFGRSSFEHTLTEPYAAIKIVPALFHTQGGLVVDENARVLRPDGSAIDGLFASGGAAMGISGHGAAGYLAGNGLLPALGLAYLAASSLTTS